MSILLLNTVIAQNKLTADEQNAIIKAADIQKSANVHDILTNYFKAGIDNLLGSKHEFNFSGTFLALDSALNIKVSNTNKYWARKNSLNLMLRGDSNNNITKMGLGFTFTLLDGRDIMYKKIYTGDDQTLKDQLNVYSKIKKSMVDYFASNPQKYTLAKKQSIMEELNTGDATHNYSNLSTETKDVLKEVKKITNIEEIDLLLKGKDFVHDDYVRIAAKYARKPLWTLTPTLNYDKTNKQGTYSIASDFIVGLGKDLTKKPWEIEAKLFYKIENDSLTLGTNYENKPLTVSVGVNKILIENEQKESKMEFKLFLQQNWQLGKINTNSEDKKFTFNSTLRISIAKSLWLPITISYDPDSKNFLGLFSITANLDN